MSSQGISLQSLPISRTVVQNSSRKKYWIRAVKGNVVFEGVKKRGEKKYGQQP